MPKGGEGMVRQIDCQVCGEPYPSHTPEGSVIPPDEDVPWVYDTRRGYCLGCWLAVGWQTPPRGGPNGLANGRAK